MSWSNFLQRQSFNPESNKKSQKSIQSRPSALSIISQSPLDKGQLFDESNIPTISMTQLTLHSISDTLKDMKVLAIQQNKSMNKLINRLEMKSCQNFKKSRQIKTSHKKSNRNNTNKKEISRIDMKIKQFDKMKKQFQECIKTINKAKRR